jgi:flagellar hook-length control protein FliK
MLIRDRFMDSFRQDLAAPEKDEAVHSPLMNRKDAAGGKDEKSGKNEGSGIHDRAGRNPGSGGQAEAAARQDSRPGRPEDFAASSQLTAEERVAGGPLPHAARPAARRTAEERAVDAPLPHTAPQPSSHKAANGPANAHDPVSAVQDDGRTSARRDEQPRGGQGEAGREEANPGSQRDSRAALLSRIEVRPPVHGADTQVLSDFALSGQSQDTGKPVPVLRQSMQQAMQQADQGSLSRLADGGQRLELNLTPSELGAVTLILTSSKSGEISATIRSERSETAELVSRHLDMIRVSLEEQGLKVDKLEVQNQTSGRQDEWKGMDQHNAMRDEQARRENLERMRRLGRHVGGNDAAPAQDVQIPGHRANISGHGLHLVA